MTRLFDRLEARILLALGLLAGLVLPHPVTTALWTAAARAFGRAGEAVWVARLSGATKFGPRIAARLAASGNTVPRRGVSLVSLT